MKRLVNVWLLTFFMAFMVLLTLTPFTTSANTNHNQSDIPDYSMTERKDVPVEWTWKIDDIYPDKNTWEKDKARVNDMINELKGLLHSWTNSAPNMLAFFIKKDNIDILLSKLRLYASLQSDTDLGNTEFQKMNGQVEVLYISFSSLLSGLDMNILELGKEKFSQYLEQEPGLKPYAIQVFDVLRTREHVLPADQAQIYSLSFLFSGGFEKASGLLNNMELPAPEITLSDGRTITLNVINYLRNRNIPNPADRTLVMKTYWANHKKFENTFATLLDSEIKKHFFYARTHNYPNCLTAKLDQDNIDPAVYLKLIEQVRANLGPFHRYIKLKQKLLKLEKFRYEDIYASSVKSVDKKYTIPQAQKVVLDMMNILGKEYTEGLHLAFKNRWIDWYPNKNKQSGYYSSGLYTVHPFVKMNYDGTYNTLAYLAHELGHAMHSYLSEKYQHYTNTDYSNFLAEIASTFNENILVDYLLEHETDDLFKLYILDEYMQGVKGSVYRQTQFADFELAMHRHVEAGESLTADWLNEKYLELVKLYYGHEQGITVVDDYIMNEWASIPHFYLNFYVYTYSTGFISSAALSDMVLKGKTTERNQYLTFLKSGSSSYSLDTLKKAGVDITTNKPYEIAFSRFDRVVTEMEKIVDRLEKKKIL